jgi:TolB-like protein
VVSGSVLLRGDSLLLQAQVIDVQTGKSVVPLEPVNASATDPSPVSTR